MYRESQAGHLRRVTSLQWVLWLEGRGSFQLGESQPKVGLNGAKPRDPSLPAFGLAASQELQG